MTPGLSQGPREDWGVFFFWRFWLEQYTHRKWALLWNEDTAIMKPDGDFFFFFLRLSRELKLPSTLSNQSGIDSADGRNFMIHSGHNYDGYQASKLHEDHDKKQTQWQVMAETSNSKDCIGWCQEPWGQLRTPPCQQSGVQNTEFRVKSFHNLLFCLYMKYSVKSMWLAWALELDFLSSGERKWLNRLL